MKIKPISKKSGQAAQAIEPNLSGLDFGQNVLDIAEHVDLVQKLNDSEKRSRTWLENSPVCTKILDTDFNLQYMSNAGITALKIKDVQPYYKNTYPFNFFPEAFKKPMNELLEKVLKSKKIFSLEAPVADLEGNELWFNSVIVPVLDTDGTVDYIMVVSMEITEKINQEKKLREAFEEVKKLKLQLEHENTYLKEEISLSSNFENMIYASDQFTAVLNKVENVAPTDAPVLIMGETGTGKELIARAIHNHSDRKDKPLIKINCAAIPGALIESELFGYEKGSFTGAIHDKLGKFELADGGTIFLDEIGELPLELQPKLLRVLQEGEIEKVGAVNTTKVNVRIIAATNKNLKTESDNGNFRTDLYFRLNVFPIEIPPLKERTKDIPVLVQHFIEKYSNKHGKTVDYISDKSMDYLNNYAWPGNVRELENIIERAVILSTDNVLFIPEIGGEGSKRKVNLSTATLDEIQRDHIVKVIQECSGKITGMDGAAAVLGLKPSTLRDRMKKLGIVREI